MTPIRTFNIPKCEDVKTEVIETIIKRLGITKAAFFLRETISQNVDYVKIKDELFKEKSASDLYKEIKMWKKMYKGHLK